MVKVIHAMAPCKLNLHLRVLERRADGYHDIESVFQLISLADELSVSISGAERQCRVISPLMELPPVNTLTQAVDQFRAATGVSAGIRVDIVKRVPSGAGLGGGSSDAAALLRSLDRLFETRLPEAALFSMAAGIGSDVPFFLSGGAAVVQGRGERIVPIAARTDLYGVLIWPGVHCSTAEAYGLVDTWHDEGKDGQLNWPAVSELGSLYRRPVGEWPFANSFTGPVASMHPVIAETIAALRQNGARFAEMSGSGSSVFGLFEEEKAAEAAQRLLSAHCKQCVKFLLLAS